MSKHASVQRRDGQLQMPCCCRAFMMQRILSGAAFGTSLLFFGCRRRDQDFLYGSLLEAWVSEGHLQLSTAFSRLQVSRPLRLTRLPSV